MTIKRINEFPEGSGSLSSDDVFLFMDDPSGSAITKKISLSSLMGGFSASPVVMQLGSVSGIINTNATLGDIFDLTLAASGTLANPASGVDGQSLRWRISHNANNLTLNFGNKFKIPASASSPLPLSNTSGSMDLLGATYDQSRDKWDIISFVPGY